MASPPENGTSTPEPAPSARAAPSRCPHFRQALRHRKARATGEGCAIGRGSAVGEGCAIGRGCASGKGCVSGRGCAIGKGCTAGKGCAVGRDCAGARGLRHRQGLCQRQELRRRQGLRRRKGCAIGKRCATGRLAPSARVVPSAGAAPSARAALVGLAPVDRRERGAGGVILDPGARPRRPGTGRCRVTGAGEDARPARGEGPLPSDAVPRWRGEPGARQGTSTTLPVAARVRRSSSASAARSSGRTWLTCGRMRPSPCHAASWPKLSASTCGANFA